MLQLSQDGSPVTKNLVDTGSLDRRLTIQRPVADASFDGAGSGAWEHVADVYASIQDILPSRAERLADGFTFSKRPSRVRMRWRSDVDSTMRFVAEGRILQIISGPAEIGRRRGLEFMVEDYRPAGNAA